jgi:hypothetical protein
MSGGKLAHCSVHSEHSWRCYVCAIRERDRLAAK